MVAKEPLAGRRFTWNAGGWFGSQLGGSCWMLVAGLLLLAHDAAVAAAVVAAFLAVNGLGLWLWSRRDRLLPYPALQLLLVALAAASLLVTLVVERGPGFEVLSVGGPPVHAWQMLVAILVLFPGLMLTFHLMERAGADG